MIAELIDRERPTGANKLATIISDLVGGLNRLDRYERRAFLPPADLITGLMQPPVVAPAKRHRKLIADLLADGSGLRHSARATFAG